MEWKCPQLSSRNVCMLIFISIGAIFWCIYQSEVVVLDLKSTNWTAMLRLSGGKTVLSEARQSRFPDTKYENWIIVTSTVRPTVAMKHLPQLSQWKVLIVGDTRTPKEWRLTNCTYISIEEQEEYQFTQLVLSGAYSRKTLGYLYAVANGARLIYDVDDDNLISRDLDYLLDETPSWQGLEYGGKSVFNPYRHFGQSSIWPRGYPIDQRNLTSSLYQVASTKRPSIIQILSNGVPDIDYNVKPVLNVTFDSTAPRVVLSSGAMGPLNSKNTLFRYEALWATVFPVTPSAEHRDVLRGYWAQRLLWEINGMVGFYRPNGYQYGKKQNVTHTVQSHLEITKLIDFLLKWKCDVKFKFFKCIQTLSKEMADAGFWQMSDYLFHKTWLDNLRQLGYVEPERKAYTGKTTSKHSNAVTFHPLEQLNPKDTKSIIQAKSRTIGKVKSYCKGIPVKFQKLKLVSPIFSEVLLVIVFNKPFYQNIPKLQLLYASVFKHIVYCGVYLKGFQQWQTKLSFKATFIEAPVRNGHQVYLCITAVMKMDYDVRGHLILGDDVLLNTWNLQKLPVDKMWFSFQNAQVMKRNARFSWYWWRLANGRVAYNAAWDTLMLIKKQQPQYKQVIENFQSTLEASTGSPLGVIHKRSDFVYIPQKYNNATIFLMDVFATKNVFLEIVIPTVIIGLEQRKNIVDLKGTYIWKPSGSKNFNASNVFLHPVKLSTMTQMKPFFCTKYLSRIWT